MTAASIASQAVPSSLGTPWQIAIFAVLIAVLVFGLVDLWRRDPEPPSSGPDDPTHSGVPLERI